uniref:MICOS complex subunit MIC60 (Fragments) n=1 Tax=Mesocricetus auratus TaxID=10036 RepID=MIC60_MESAU|nr:RecName: Full=MICOS complex subunit MIC60; AltName: Full=Mitochondrial inner membrane protein; AltName: Full=Mitofilin [Mesocricetus auratus]
VVSQYHELVVQARLSEQELEFR